MKNRFFSVLPLIAVALFFAQNVSAAEKISDSPSWYISPKQNNSEKLYGVSEGYTMEDATKYALADVAARLIVTVSSESTLVREENSNAVNEEMRQSVRQNVEKISFSNFKVTESDKIGQKFFVEVAVDKAPFVNEQRDRAGFLERQITDLDKNSLGKNTIQRRNALLKITGLGNELELKSRILNGVGDDINLKQKLARIADFKSQLDSFSNKIEFYFEIDSPKEIAKIIRTALNREQIKISTNRNPSNPNQVVIRVKSESRTNEVYGAKMTKVEVDFENMADGKVAASNSVEVTGSSMISEKESYRAAIASLEEKITKDGIMKILGLEVK